MKIRMALLTILIIALTGCVINLDDQKNDAKLSITASASSITYTATTSSVSDFYYKIVLRNNIEVYLDKVTITYSDIDADGNAVPQDSLVNEIDDLGSLYLSNKDDEQDLRVEYVPQSVRTHITNRATGLNHVYATVTMEFVQTENEKVLVKVLPPIDIVRN